MNSTKIITWTWQGTCCLFVLMASTVAAAEIDWSDRIDASENLPQNNGNVIEAVNVAGPEVEINGILFLDGDDGGDINHSNLLDAFPSCCSDNGAPTAPTDEMGMMLDSHRWLSTGGQAQVATLVLEGLEQGSNYDIQLYYSDFRPGSFKEYYWAGDNASISELFTRGTTEDNWSFIGSFTADSDQQRVHLIPNGTRLDGFVNHDPGISGYVLSVSTLPCDVNGDGVCDANDIDAMTQKVIDGTATLDERTALVEDPAPDGLNTWIGDSDMNGQFDEQDIVAAFVEGQYLTGERAVWVQGDWDGNFLFDEQDFVAAFVAGGYLLGQRPAAAAVPEPTGLALLTWGILIWSWRRTR